MKLKQKIALGLVGISLITTGSYFGGKTLYETGYKNGNQEMRQKMVQKLRTVGSITVENCDHRMNNLKDFMYYYKSSKEEQERLQVIYDHTLDKRNDVRDLIDTVSNKNISYGNRDTP